MEWKRMWKILRQPFPVQIMTHQKQLENVKYFNWLGSMMTNGARCTRELNHDCQCKSSIQQ
jgi:hypothetical protein